MFSTLLYIVLGYLSGSILFARIAAGLFHKNTILTESADANPGTANAFVYGGFLCGIFTLLGDLLKGFLPVYLFLHTQHASALPFSFILAAPVLGHAFPIFYRFKGGKGIAVSFGCLLGLLPERLPVAILIFYFLFFTLIFKIYPNFYRTLITYLCSAVTMSILLPDTGVILGFWFITAILFWRFHISREKREEMRFAFLWKH